MNTQQPSRLAYYSAYAALYLACDESSFVTGALLPVDGGMGTRIG